LSLAISRVEDWLKPAFARELRSQASEILDAAALHDATGKLSGQTIDAEIFVRRLPTRCPRADAGVGVFYWLWRGLPNRCASDERRPRKV